MGSVVIKRLWWLHPSWLFALVVGSTMALAISQSEHSYQLYDTPKYLHAYHGLLAVGSIAAFAIGCQWAFVNGRTSKPLDLDAVAWLRMWVYFVCGLSIFGYSVWMVVAIKNGFSIELLRDILLGDDAELTYALATDIFENVPGITTCTQFAVAAVPLGVWLYSLGDRRIIWPVAAVLLAGLTRAFILSERIALIELVVPASLILIRQFLLNKPNSHGVAWAMKFAPFLGILGLLLFFGCAEYFRSWKHYQKDFDSVAEFTVWRLSGYYTTSHNNGAMALETPTRYDLPFYTLQSLWTFPGVSSLPIGYKNLTGIYAVDQHLYMLERFGTPELNNGGGLFSPAIDFGVLGMLLFWFGSGFVSGKLYRGYLAGAIEGIILYPIFFLAILEVPRFLYISNQRAFPALAASFLIIWFVNRQTRTHRIIQFSGIIAFSNMRIQLSFAYWLLLPTVASTMDLEFERDVAPILEAHCLSCHDASQAKGDVRLDDREHALDFIVLGKPGESLLIDQVSGPEPEMPKQSTPLSIDQVRILRKWIEAGAAWPAARVLKDNPPRNLDWWSLQPIEVALSNEGHHPVDAFLNAMLDRRKLQSVVEADGLTLLRRLSFDLTGLPPTIEDIVGFSKTNYEATVDRLLSSPAFGEKWAQHWLDVARYAETHGYDKDKLRLNAWPYRDYVIRAFNDDKAFDRFVQEQIAGDGLFPGEADGVLGLGFLAAGPWDFIGHSEVGEGKIDGRIAKHLDRDEMISAVFNVFISTTVQCAQCHHHKFDPVRMEDYYRLHAVFAAVDRADRIFAGLPPIQVQERNQLLSRINALKAEQDALDKGIAREVAGRSSGIARRIAELKTKHGSPLRPQYGWHSQISRTQEAAKWVQVDLGSLKAVDQVRLIPAFDQFGDIGAGFGFPVRYKIEGAEDEAISVGVRLLRDATDVDQPNPKNRELVVDVGGNAVRYIRVTATKLALRKNDYIFALGELEAIGGEAQDNLARNAVVTSLDSIEQGPRWGRGNLIDGTYHRELDDPTALAELRQLEDERTAIEAALHTPEIVKRLSEIAEQLPSLSKQLAAFSKGQLVYAASSSFDAQGRFIATGGKPRPIQLLHRGDIRSPGETMRPGTTPLWPSARAEFKSSNDGTESTMRASLAQAITSKDNPLFWRSIANRLWLWTFGKPLVGTPNDFGRMGMRPTHPELLDYLAARLRDDPKHSLKAIVRLLVTSQAYRRSSIHDEISATQDADNTLLWRANRRRLTAEEFRDTVLAIGGKLQLDQRGGPSFQDFVIEKPQHSPHYEYQLHDPEDTSSHRRSIYRFVVRSQPQPFLTALDCADPSLSVAVRDESTTALQALAQWNNRLIEVMSKHFGERIESNAGDKIDFAYRIAVGRPPNTAEHAALAEHLEAYGPASLARLVFNLNAFVYID